MAVPNTTTFSLQDVVDEVLPSQEHLSGCIDEAVSSHYDNTYYTSPATNLLEFRNYTNPSVTSVQMTSAGYADSSTACSQSSYITRYITGGDATPSNGEIVYENSNGSQLFNGGNNWFKSSGGLSFQISTTGVISNLTFC